MPINALLTIHSIPEKFKALHEGITAHGLLASFLAFSNDGMSQYTLWKASWPSLQDFQQSMPLLWPNILREPIDQEVSVSNVAGMGKNPCEPFWALPPAIGARFGGILEVDASRSAGLLDRQQEKLHADWKMVSKLFPNKGFLEYTYYWLIVNTRSFYFDVLPGNIQESHYNRIVLCPFVDLFNHSDHGVS